MPMCEMSKKGFEGMLIKNPEYFFDPTPFGADTGKGEGRGDITKLCDMSKKGSMAC